MFCMKFDCTPLFLDFAYGQIRFKHPKLCWACYAVEWPFSSGGYSEIYWGTCLHHKLPYLTHVTLKLPGHFEKIVNPSNGENQKYVVDPDVSKLHNFTAWFCPSSRMHDLFSTSFTGCYCQACACFRTFWVAPVDTACIINYTFQFLRWWFVFFLFRICKYDDAKIKMVQAELDAQVFIYVDESVIQDEF